MITYEVRITEKAEEQVQAYLEYLLFHLKSEQAYEAVKADYERTLHRLEVEAGALAICENLRLAKHQLKRILFDSHEYVLLFRIINDCIAEVVEMHHMSEDYANRIR